MHVLVKNHQYIIQTVCASGLLAAQVYRWYHLCDQSSATYIQEYATSLISPLPKGALLFINYDLQWTALRYLQRCEGLRLDVTVINLSMMTYKWFASKHNHYPRMMFPGSHLVPSGSQSGFSMQDLMQANYDTFKDSGIYLGGKLSFHDAEFHQMFTTIPMGLVSQVHLFHCSL